MSTVRPLLQFAAVASSLCLMAGFVAYRVSSARREQVVQRPSADARSGADAQDLTGAGDARPARAADEMLFSGSKSGPIVRPEPAEAPPSVATAQEVPRLLISTSKSGPIVVQQDIPADPPPPTRALIGGSKSMVIVPAGEVERRAAAEPARRRLIGGSKSAAVVEPNDVGFNSVNPNTDTPPASSEGGALPRGAYFWYDVFWWVKPKPAPKPEPSK